MARNYSPKLIATAEAREAADFHLVLKDLKHVTGCCEELLSHTMLISPYHVVARALCTSALVTYRKCFKSGHRVPINIDECNFLSDEDRKHHKYCIDLADKHIAHSVNGYERANMTIHIAEDEDNVSLVRGGLGSSAHLMMGFGLDDVCQLAQRVNSIVAEFVKPQIKNLESVITRQVEQMSDDELRALPEGFVPYDGIGGVDKPRKPPYISDRKR